MLNLKEDTKRLINAYGVSGGEFGASAVAQELLTPYVDKIEVDAWGNVAGYRFCGKEGCKKLLLDAHIDQIGYMVSGITPDGLVRFVSLNAPEDSLPGSELTILSKSGPVTGVVGWLPPEELPAPGQGEAIPALSRMFIDLGLTEKEAREMIGVGDLISYGCDAIDLAGDAIAGKSTDDRICFMSIVYAMSLLKDVALNVDVIAVGSTKEEFDSAGARARAWRDQPDYVIALDVSEFAQPGKGAIIARGGDSSAQLAERLSEVARAKKIPYVARSIPEVSGTNAKHYQISASGSVTCVVSQPQKYMHFPIEIVRICDIESVGGLLAAFIRSFDGTL